MCVWGGDNYPDNIILPSPLLRHVGGSSSNQIKMERGLPTKYFTISKSHNLSIDGSELRTIDRFLRNA